MADHEILKQTQLVQSRHVMALELLCSACWLLNPRTHTLVFENKPALSKYFMRDVLEGMVKDSSMTSAEVHLQLTEGRYLSLQRSSYWIESLEYILFIEAELPDKAQVISPPPQPTSIETLDAKEEVIRIARIGYANLHPGTLGIQISTDLAKILDLPLERETIIPLDTFFSTFVVKSFQGIIQGKVSSLLADENSDGFSVSFSAVTDINRVIWVETTWVRQKHSIFILFQDNSDKRTSVTDKVVQSKVIRNMLYSITDGFFALDRNFNFTLVNPTFSQVAGLATEEIVGKNILELFPYMKDGTTLAQYTDALTNNVAKYFEIKQEEVEVVYEVLAFPYSNGLFVYFRDVTKSRSHQRQQEKLDKIVRESHNEIYIVSVDKLYFQYGNKSALKNIGYTIDELCSLTLNNLFHFPDELGLSAILGQLKTNEVDSLNLNLKFRRKDNSVYDAEVLIQVLEHGMTYVMFVTDITNRLITEHKLLQNLREKEILIQEIHHRVKNNLQLISSILFLKKISVPQKEFAAFLDRTRNRIHTIALIHEKLLQRQNIDKIEITDYLATLAREVEVAYAESETMVRVEFDFENHILKLDNALYCGLILNELMTNSFKHAFQGKPDGKIFIGFKEKDGFFFLTISDNGVVRPGFEPEVINGMGMELLNFFVKQLHGSIKMDWSEGAHFEIKFRR